MFLNILFEKKCLYIIINNGKIAIISRYKFKCIAVVFSNWFLLFKLTFKLKLNLLGFHCLPRPWGLGRWTGTRLWFFFSIASNNSRCQHLLQKWNKLSIIQDFNILPNRYSWIWNMKIFWFVKLCINESTCKCVPSKKNQDDWTRAIQMLKQKHIQHAVHCKIFEYIWTTILSLRQLHKSKLVNLTRFSMFLVFVLFSVHNNMFLNI